MNDQDKDRLTVIILGLAFLFMVNLVTSCEVKKQCIKRNNCKTMNIEID